MAARDADGGTSRAHRRRERRQRSWWRHEQLSVAAALTSHHSAGPGVVTRREEQQEEEEHEKNDGLRAQNTPPPGDAAVVGDVAAGAPSLVVVPVAKHDGLDDATVQFLLQQSLRMRAAEEEAKELEDVAVMRERRLLRLLGELGGAGPQANLTILEQAALSWFSKTKVMKRKEKRKKKRRKPGSLLTCSP